jgi:ammonium transporter, Amt family
VESAGAGPTGFHDEVREMDEATLQTVLNSLWVVVAATLVFFMHAGFALVESGFCRRKNAVMVLLKNVGVISIAGIVYYLLGWGLMYGEGNAFIGLSEFAPSGVAREPGELPYFVDLFFQLVFAATACTIVSGAVAERARLGTFLTFTAIGTVGIYSVVGHWKWGGGWLEGLGFQDFAGSTLVHAVGGGMALAGALVVGPRVGKYLKDGSVKPMPAHNFPMAALGVLILWLGWFGFNGGSQLAASSLEDVNAIGSIVFVTNLAASAGFLGALLWTKVRTGMLDLSMGLNGALGGLVGITAGADVIAPLSAMAVGVLSSMIVVESVFFLEKLKIDDPVGAISVHGAAGIFGTLAVGIFGADASVALLGVQALGAFSGFLFAFALGLVVWFGLKVLVPGGVRVSESHELEGLDMAECGVSAYGEELSGVSGAAEGATAISRPMHAPSEAAAT